MNKASSAKIFIFQNSIARLPGCISVTKIALTALLITFFAIFFSGCGACAFEYSIINYSRGKISVSINSNNQPSDLALSASPESELSGFLKNGSKVKISAPDRQRCYYINDYDHLLSKHHKTQIDWHDLYDTIANTNARVTSDACE